MFLNRAGFQRSFRLGEESVVLSLQAQQFPQLGIICISTLPTESVSALSVVQPTGSGHY